MTLDSAQIDLSRAFVEGMGYVALSRVRGLKHLILDGMNGMALRTSLTARQLDGELRARSIDVLDASAEIIKEWQAAEQLRKEAPATKPDKKGASWNDRLAKMRENYPNAYKPWAETEDVKLVKLFAAGNGIKSLSKLMGRHPGSVRARLKKHFGDEVVIPK
jgi:hypothetical protein